MYNKCKGCLEFTLNTKLQFAYRKLSWKPFKQVTMNLIINLLELS